MKRVLISGSSGMLGSNIVFELKDKYELFGIDRNPADIRLKKQFAIDINEYDKIRFAIESVRPDYIVHCAAITNVERCENDYLAAHATNGLATKNLVSAITPQARFIYISTDSVFDGRKGDYSEDDFPSPLNNYAKTKLEGEWYVEQALENYVIVRTNIFGWNRIRGESFAEWVVNNLNNNNPIRMFTDVIFAPLYVNTLIYYIEQLLSSNFTGRLNFGCVDSMTKYEFGIKLAKLFGFDTSLISPVSIDLFNFKAKRPKNTTLNVSKAMNIFSNLPIIADEMMKFYKSREREIVKK